MNHETSGFGIDIGGTGMKAAIVDLGGSAPIHPAAGAPAGGDAGTLVDRTASDRIPFGF